MLKSIFLLSILIASTQEKLLAPGQGAAGKPSEAAGSSQEVAQGASLTLPAVPGAQLSQPRPAPKADPIKVAAMIATLRAPGIEKRAQEDADKALRDQASAEADALLEAKRKAKRLGGQSSDHLVLPSAGPVAVPADSFATSSSGTGPVRPLLDGSSLPGSLTPRIENPYYGVPNEAAAQESLMGLVVEQGRGGVIPRGSMDAAATLIEATAARSPGGQVTVAPSSSPASTPAHGVPLLSSPPTRAVGAPLTIDPRGGRAPVEKSSPSTSSSDASSTQRLLDVAKSAILENSLSRRLALKGRVLTDEQRAQQEGRLDKAKEEYSKVRAANAQKTLQREARRIAGVAPAALAPFKASEEVFTWATRVAGPFGEEPAPTLGAGGRSKTVGDVPALTMPSLRAGLPTPTRARGVGASVGASDARPAPALSRLGRASTVVMPSLPDVTRKGGAGKVSKRGGQ